MWRCSQTWCWGRNWPSNNFCSKCGQKRGSVGQAGGGGRRAALYNRQDPRGRAVAEGVVVIECLETPVTLPIRAALDLGLGLTASQATEVVVAPIGVAAARAVVTSLCASQLR